MLECSEAEESKVRAIIDYLADHQADCVTVRENSLTGKDTFGDRLMQLPAREI